MVEPRSLVLAARLEDGESLQVGERVTLRVALRNHGSETSSTASLTLSAPPALALVSTSPYRRVTARRASGLEHELGFELPALLADEELALEVDAYALAAGDAAVRLRLESEQGLEETTIACPIDARPAFASGANRLEIHAREAEAGSVVEGRLVVTNTGRAAAVGCTVRVYGDLDDLALDETISALAPQERRIIRFAGRIPTPLVDGAWLRVGASVRFGDREELLGECGVAGRSRARFDPSSSHATAEPASFRPGAESNVTIVVHNSGNDAARDLRVELALPPWLAALSVLPLAIGKLEAGASTTVQAGVRAVERERRCGTVEATLVARELAPVALAPVGVEIVVEPVFAGSISARAESIPRAGERVAWELRLTNEGDARAAEVRVALAFAGAVYLPGTTVIEGARLIDVRGSSPLWTAGGLAFEFVEPQTTITIGCTAILEPDAAAATMWARAVCEEREVLIESPSLAVLGTDESAPPLPYSVPGARLRADDTKVPAPVPVPPGELFTRSFESRLDAPAARHLASLRGLMRHLWALAVLCADPPHVGATRTALRSVFDRLSIKLRMPHYPVGADDVIDPAAREGLAGLGITESQLGAKLARAAGLIAPVAGTPLAREAFERYGDALAAALRDLDDGSLIDALVAPQPHLDDCLDAAIALEASPVHA